MHSFTAADVIVAYNLRWGQQQGMATDDPILVAYTERVEKREAYREAFSDGVRLHVYN